VQRMAGVGQGGDEIVAGSVVLRRARVGHGEHAERERTEFGLGRHARTLTQVAARHHPGIRCGARAGAALRGHRRAHGSKPSANRASRSGSRLIFHAPPP
jgi:hypothetical protein